VFSHRRVIKDWGKLSRNLDFGQRLKSAGINTCFAGCGAGDAWREVGDGVEKVK